MADEDELSEDDCPKCHQQMATRHCNCCDGGYIEDEDDEFARRELCDRCNGDCFETWCRECGWDDNFKCFLSKVYERQFLANQTMSNHKIIAVDFDGTCVLHEYPKVGADLPHAVEVLKKLNAAGVKIIVWTMRCGVHLDTDARAWFEARGIEVWAYNSNPEQSAWTESPKCYAHHYIDDAAIGCPLIYPADGDRPYVNWFEVEKILIERGFLNAIEEIKN